MIDITTIEDICKQRPSPRREYDQLPATPPTILRRAVFIVEKCLSAGQRVLFLGDDDFVSVAVALACRAVRVTVVDVDKRILAAIALAAEKFAISVKVEHYDVRLPLPPRFQCQFESCVTDPPYTVDGFSGFLCRAVSAVRPGPGRNIIAALSQDDVRNREWQICISRAERLGLHLKQVVHGFNRYDLAQRDWEVASEQSSFLSSLLWFETTLTTVKRTAAETCIDWNRIYDYCNA